MKSRYRKLAQAAYERVADGADHFDIADVIDEIVEELSEEDTSQDLIREFAVSLADRADKEAAKRADSGQLDLFSGDPEAFDSVWALGDGKRVRVRDAKRRDVVARLGICGDNAARVAAGWDRVRQQLGEVLVWMPDEDTTVPQAVAARKDAQPPQD